MDVASEAVVKRVHEISKKCHKTLNVLIVVVLQNMDKDEKKYR